MVVDLIRSIDGWCGVGLVVSYRAIYIACTCASDLICIFQRFRANPFIPTKYTTTFVNFHYRHFCCEQNRQDYFHILPESQLLG